MKETIQINQSGKMRQDLYQELFEMEKDYWWHRAKRSNVKSLLNKYLDKKEGGKFLDVGCGTGLMLEELKDYGESIGVDLFQEALNFCRKRGSFELYKADAHNLPFEDGSIKVVTALDILEHTDDDGKVLREFQRVLALGGLLVITVPAYQRLWSYWDEILGHKRRYSVSSLVDLLKENGFKVEKSSYANLSILLPSVLVRKAKALAGRDSFKTSSDFFSTPKPLNYLLTRIYDLERFFLLRFGLPFGLSVIAVGRKEKQLCQR